METGRTVVITGASTGIGEACALHLDQLGFRVFAGVRKEIDGEALKRKGSERLQPLLLDITEGRSIAAAAATVREAVGEAGVYGLVNNAGIVVACMLEFVPLEELRYQLEVNVVAQVAVTQAFLPLLRKARGRIINIGSNSGFLATPFLGPYCASKFALEALTDSLRIELRPWGMDVSIVEPGDIRTPIWKKSSEAAERLLRALPKEAHELYDSSLGPVRAAAENSAARAIAPDAVARVVARALRAKRPTTRYRVGKDSTIQALLARFVPDRLRDALIANYIGLPKRA